MLNRLIQRREEKKFEKQLYLQLDNINMMIEATLDKLYEDHRLVLNYEDGSSITVFIDHIKMIERNADHTCRLFLSVSDYIDTPYSYDVLPIAIALYKKNESYEYELSNKY
ncbi:hypothetical protein [Mycoplasma sp. P36-A1]|uniref:hypothetical protein n=1 Tax=Mycoplasma sp. P36-A1 TaxID=3252900 RepID=UPI003C2CC123